MINLNRDDEAGLLRDIPYCTVQYCTYNLPEPSEVVIAVAGFHYGHSSKDPEDSADNLQMTDVHGNIDIKYLGKILE